MEVPREHVPDVWSLSEEIAIRPCTGHASLLAAAVREVIEPEGLNIIQSNGEVATQTVPHLQAHLVPRWTADATRPIWPEETDDTEGDKDQMQERLRDACRRNRLPMTDTAASPTPDPGGDASTSTSSRRWLPACLLRHPTLRHGSSQLLLPPTATHTLSGPTPCGCFGLGATLAFRLPRRQPPSGRRSGLEPLQGSCIRAVQHRDLLASAGRPTSRGPNQRRAIGLLARHVADQPTAARAERVALVVCGGVLLPGRRFGCSDRLRGPLGIPG